MTQYEYGRLLVAKSTANFDYRGNPIFITAGQTVVREGHPITKGHEELFEPLKVHYELPPPKSARSDDEDDAPVSHTKASHAGARTR